MKKIYLIISLIVITFAGFRFWPTISNHASLTDKENIASAEAPKYQPPDTTQLKQQVQAVIDANPNLQIGIGIINLKNGDEISMGVQEPFDAASTNKLLTATYYLKQVDEGKETLDKQLIGGSARTLLRKMIVDSDNTAWKNMNDYSGRENLESFASTLGLSSYSSANNTISAIDEARILKKIDDGALSQNSKSVLLGYMKEADVRDYIVAAVPSSYTVYHKAGWLKDRVHDTAIIDMGSEKFALVIFTKSTGQYNYQKGQKLFKDITTYSIQAFTR